MYLCSTLPPRTPPEIGNPVSTNIVRQITLAMWLKSTTCLYALRTKTCKEKNSNEVQLLVLARSWFPGSVLARTQNVEPVVWVMILQKVELVIWTLGSRNYDTNQPQNQLVSCHLVFIWTNFIEISWAACLLPSWPYPASFLSRFMWIITSDHCGGMPAARWKLRWPILQVAVVSSIPVCATREP